MILVALAVIVGLSTFGALMLGRGADRCDGLIESQRSPNGFLIAERYANGCASDSAVVKLSIRPQEGKPPQTKDFFLSTHLSTPNLPDVLFKWLSDSSLLVAIPEESGREKWMAEFRKLQKPQKFRGVSLIYAVYSKDPDHFRDATSKVISRKPARFDYRFQTDKNSASLPSIGCSLYMTAPDGQHFNQLSLRLSASKTSAHKARRGTTVIDVPERSSASILVSGDYAIANSTGYATAAALDTLLPITETMFNVRASKPIRAPNGASLPMWQIYWEIGLEDITVATNKIKEGAFEVKVGLWLDNAEVIYPNVGPADLGVLDDFTRCIAENGIFAETR